MGRQKFRKDTPREDTQPAKCVRLIVQNAGLPYITEEPLKTDIFVCGTLAVEIHGPQHFDETQHEHDLWKERKLAEIGVKSLWLPYEWCNMKYHYYLLRLILLGLGRSTLEQVDTALD